MRHLWSSAIVAMLSMTTVAVAAPEVLQPHELFDCGDVPEGVHQTTETFPDLADPLGTVTVHLVCYAPGGAAQPDACSSDAYSLTGWKWASKYSARFDPTNSGLSASGVGSAFGQSGNAWDAAVGASIWGGVTQNSNGGNAGKKDNVNQFGFKQGGNYIAVTYTWSSGGNAVESDGRYNTAYPWSLSGEANKMDLQNIATHELGHTFGLGHSSTAQANACLTMYPYADYGETQKRSLESGDKLGIEALY